MTYEAFRAEMLAYRSDVEAEGTALKGSQWAIERLIRPLPPLRSRRASDGESCPESFSS
jgi:hypothetical protein